MSDIALVSGILLSIVIFSICFTLNESESFLFIRISITENVLKSEPLLIIHRLFTSFIK